MSDPEPRPQPTRNESAPKFVVGGRAIPFGIMAGVIVLVLLLVCGCLAFGPLNNTVREILNPPSETEVVVTETATEPPTDRPTEPVDVPTDDQPAEPPGNGRCNAVCDPQASNCLAGLDCLPKSSASTEYICWNSDICLGSDTTPIVTEPPTQVSTEPVVECGPGWLPLAGCTCCGSTLLCADGTVAQFNPTCMGGPNVTPPFCGDGVCSPSEVGCGVCSIDCGPC